MGYIVADPATQATSVPGVFAGGDIVTGAATVILAMAPGGAPPGDRRLAGRQQDRLADYPADADAFVPRPGQRDCRCGFHGVSS